MTMRLFLKNTKTGKRYEIVGRDPKANTVTLKGDHGSFDEKYDPASFKSWGYVLEKEAPDAVQ